MALKTYFRRVFRYLIKGIPEVKTIVEVKQSFPNELLKDKNIIVTGGSKGIGFHIAKKCIDEGAKVLIVGRNENELNSAISKLGTNCKYLVFDVQNVDKTADFISKAEEIFNGEKIYALVSNAGVSLHEGDFRNVTEKGWDTQFNVNLKGNYFLVKEFINYLENQSDKSGNIVVITSERGFRNDDLPYGLTKVASNSFIKCFASKVIDEGIRINGVAPGVTVSDMTGIKRNDNLYADWMPANRFFIPEEVAEVVNFLLSDLSSSISGEIIACDKGRYITHW